MSHFRIPVSEYMTSLLITIKPGESVIEADQLLHEHDISALPIVDRSARLQGVLTRTDLLRAGSYEREHTLRLPDAEVSELMSKPVITVEPSATLAEAAAKMLEHSIHRVFVATNDFAVGVLSTRDLMQAVIDQDTKLPLGEIQSAPIVGVAHDMSLSQAVDMLDDSHKQGLVVMEQDWPVGIFDQRSALAARGLKPSVPVSEAMSMSVVVLPAQLPIARAAAQCTALKVRRVAVMNGNDLSGIVGGLDFARLVAD